MYLRKPCYHWYS